MLIFVVRTEIKQIKVLGSHVFNELRTLADISTKLYSITVGITDEDRNQVIKPVVEVVEIKEVVCLCILSRRIVISEIGAEQLKIELIEKVS
jgi:hypothetical protein